MDPQTLCEQIAVAVNQAEGWGMSATALADLVRELLPFLDDDLAADDCRKIMTNYYRDC
jgi:hypothetical protein